MPHDQCFASINQITYNSKWGFDKSVLHINAKTTMGSTDGADPISVGVSDIPKLINVQFLDKKFKLYPKSMPTDHTELVEVFAKRVLF